MFDDPLPGFDATDEEYPEGMNQAVPVKTKWRLLRYIDWQPFEELWLYWLSTHRRLQSSFGHSKSECSFVSLCVMSECLQSFCKSRMVSSIFEEFFIVQKKVSVMVYLFLSTMMSENGFLLISGSERSTFAVLNERQQQLTYWQRLFFGSLFVFFHVSLILTDHLPNPVLHS